MKLRRILTVLLTSVAMFGGLLEPQTASVWAAPQTEVEPNNTKETANVIDVGSQSPMAATITNKDDLDYFRFTAVQGQQYVVETFNVAKATNTSNYPLQVAIYDQNFSKIGEDVGGTSNGAGNTSGSVSFVATTGGTYYILVYPYSYGAGSGPYSLRVLPAYDQPGASWDTNQEPNNWASHAFKLEVDAANAITSTIEQRDNSYITDTADRDWFRFDAVQGQQYVVETFNVAKATNTSDYPLQVVVYDKNFSKVAEDTGGEGAGVGNSSGSVSFTATTGGSYFVLVYPYSYGAGSGPYSIRVLPNYDQPSAAWDANHEPNNWASHAFKLEVGAANAVTSTIEQRDSSYITQHADRDWFRFDAVQGQKYVVETFNVAKAINTSNYPMQVEVYDRNSSKVAEDTGAYADATGNTSGSVEFTATTGGTYFILVYPYYYNAGSGPYSIRVLPQYDQPAASWDAAFEPNNFATNAYPLPVDPCARQSSVTPRNSSYITANGDRDWYVFTLEKGKQYTFELTNVAPSLGAYGLETAIYNQEFSKIKEMRYNDTNEYTFTADASGTYYALVYPYNNDLSGSYQIRVAETLSACGGETPPKAVVEGNVSTGTNPNTGEVTVRGPRSGGTPVIFTFLATCSVGTPQQVSLLIGAQAFAATVVSGTRYNAAVTLAPSMTNAPIKASYTCGGQAVLATIGIVVLVDPSGTVTDATTGNTVRGATVTLYRVPGATPDKPGVAGACRTIDTRGGTDWTGLPPATVVADHKINPLLDALRDVVQISPQINPQVTGNDGKYAWNVVEGCWYVEVQAPGYTSVVSPVVGTPPAVMDLNFALNPAAASNTTTVFLPIVQH